MRSNLKQSFEGDVLLRLIQKMLVIETSEITAYLEESEDPTKFGEKVNE